MTNKDHDLMSGLAELNSATATFSTDLFMGQLDRDAHIAMTLLLLKVADQVLKHIIESDPE